VTPSVVKVIFPHFVINENQKNFSNQNSNNVGLLAPFPFTSLSETFEARTTFPNNNPTRIFGSYFIESHKENVFTFPVMYIDSTNTSLSFPTLGPCAGNGLETEKELIWTKLDFSFEALRGISINGTITRIYQNALLPLDVPQWILFGPGLRSSYAFIVPLNSEIMYLQIEIRRHDASVPPPSQFFDLLSIVTQQKCLNFGIIDPNKPGIIQHYRVNGTSNAETISLTLENVQLPSGTNVYLSLNPQGPNCCRDLSPYDKKYSITASIKGITPEPGHTPNHALDVFGIVCGVLVIIGGIALVVTICYRKRRGQYIMIQN